MLLLAATSGSKLPAPRSDFFLRPSSVYLNTGTLGPCPRDVVLNSTRDWELLESDPADEYFGMFTRDPFTARMDAVRDLAAAYIGASRGVALVPSTTIGLNTVADGLIGSGFLTEGDVVLTSDQEHAGGYVNWLHYTNCTGMLKAEHWCSKNTKTAHRPITLVPVAIPVAPASAAPSTPSAIVDLFRAAMERHPRTKVIAVSHVTTTHGLALPIAELARLAHSRGALMVVDGAQAMGMDVNVTALEVDAYATSAHKWLLAPKGNGILYLSPRARPLVAALLLDDGFGVYSGATGTRPPQTILGLGYALSYLNSLGGAAAIGAYNKNLRALAFDGISQISKKLNASGMEIIGARMRGGPLASPILTFSLPPPHTSHSFAAAMYARGFIVKQAGKSSAANEGGPTMPQNAVRLSFHVFISEQDVQRLLAAVEEVLRSAGGSASANGNAEVAAQVQ